MLVEFRVGNFRSFAAAQVFSLVASHDDSHPAHLLDCGKFNLVRAAAIYGPNASGKSNLIKALAVMDRFVRESATKINLGEPIPGIVPFRLDAQWQQRPSTFEVTVLVNSTRYRYGFSATVERVHREWLDVCRPGGRLVNQFQRRFDPQTERTDWSFREAFKKDAKILKERTRDNGLLLSRAAELNVEFVKELFLWFQNRLRLIDMAEPPLSLVSATAVRLHTGSKDRRERSLKLIRDADLGIASVEVANVPVDVPEDVPGVSQHRPGFGNWDELDLSIQTGHQVADSSIAVPFSLQEDESKGTQRFFALTGPILDALDEGHTLVLDELDCSLHPLLIRKLIELFQSPDVNANGAQLVFATHDSTLMDSTLFRRDQVWLCEKRKNGSTELFSLYDIDAEDKPRKGEAFQKNYLAGRYGGVPLFGPTLEDLEIR